MDLPPLPADERPDGGARGHARRHPGALRPGEPRLRLRRPRHRQGRRAQHPVRRAVHVLAQQRAAHPARADLRRPQRLHLLARRRPADPLLLHPDRPHRGDAGHHPGACCAGAGRRSSPRRRSPAPGPTSWASSRPRWRAPPTKPGRTPSWRSTAPASTTTPGCCARCAPSRRRTSARRPSGCCRRTITCWSWWGRPPPCGPSWKNSARSRSRSSPTRASEAGRRTGPRRAESKAFPESTAECRPCDCASGSRCCCSQPSRRRPGGGPGRRQAGRRPVRDGNRSLQPAPASRATTRSTTWTTPSRGSASRQLRTDFPQHPAPPFYLATTEWIQLLNAKRRLQTGLYAGQSFFAEGEDKPDPRVDAEFRRLVAASLELAKAAEARNPQDPAALYYQGSAHGLLASYEATVMRSFLPALRNGLKSMDLSRRIVAMDPNFPRRLPDHRGLRLHRREPAFLRQDPGRHRRLPRLAGAGPGRAAAGGGPGPVSQDEARILLITFFAREKRWADCLRIVEELARRFPRNYLFRLEQANLLEKLGRTEQSREQFEALLRDPAMQQAADLVALPVRRGAGRTAKIRRSRRPVPRGGRPPREPRRSWPPRPACAPGRCWTGWAGAPRPWRSTRRSCAGRTSSTPTSSRKSTSRSRSRVSR